MREIDEISEKRTKIMYDKNEQRRKPMTITTTELKKDLGKYLAISTHEQIIILKHGKPYTVLGAKPEGRPSIANLFGVLPRDFDVDRALTERGNDR